MTWTNQEYKAMYDYAKRNSLRMTLSTKPEAMFYDSGGVLIKKNIAELVQNYVVNKKEDQKQRARAKRDRVNKRRKYDWQE